MFSLESPHRGDSNDYTQYTIFNLKTKITLYYPKSACKMEFETAGVYEPSVFEPLKFYCIFFFQVIKENKTERALAIQMTILLQTIHLWT